MKLIITNEVYSCRHSFIECYPNRRKYLQVRCKIPFTPLSKECSSWFQIFAVFWILYVFFWVFSRRLIVVCRRFGTLYLFHLHRLDKKYEVCLVYKYHVLCSLTIIHTSYPAYEDGTDRVFRNVGIRQSDAGEIPKRIHKECPSVGRKYWVRSKIFRGSLNPGIKFTLRIRRWVK